MTATSDTASSPAIRSLIPARIDRLPRLQLRGAPAEGGHWAPAARIADQRFTHWDGCAGWDGLAGWRGPTDWLAGWLAGWRGRAG